MTGEFYAKLDEYEQAVKHLARQEERVSELRGQLSDIFLAEMRKVASGAIEMRDDQGRPIRADRGQEGGG